MNDDDRLKTTSRPLTAPSAAPTSERRGHGQRQVLRVAGHHHRAEHGRERDDGADRQVDAAEDHHQGGADRGDADRRRLAQDVAEVDRLEEGVGERDGDQIEQRQHDRIAQRESASLAAGTSADERGGRSSSASPARRAGARAGVSRRRALAERARVATIAATTISPLAKVCTNAETSSRFSTLVITPSSSTAARVPAIAAAAAGQRRAAEHHGDDGVELEALAGVRIAGAEPAGDDQAAQAPRRGPTA